jgi:predicted nucleic acid-binding protein
MFSPKSHEGIPRHASPKSQIQLSLKDKADLAILSSAIRGGSDVFITGDREILDLLLVCPIQGSRRALVVAMDRALIGLPIARDIMVLTPEEFERDRYIPGTIARPAWKEGRILYESP